MTRARVDKILHLRKGTAAEWLTDTPFFLIGGRQMYHIDEVAEAMWERRML